ncbi:amidase [Dulcicalothrix desertica PCC 7102]|uniref:Amidase n=1 Tax=Dulcicalothrix desertica PCC 7102 TaxID=232991 RepID=A0A433VAZ2_9CYAN|nr:amidase [Dulcicalothrix desertica]RUT03271.1 amidase [Dulcicalothrix desertica PCC 7102]TWH53636.1 amidase [Dulcicalothrix desertica PCC 7102]
MNNIVFLPAHKIAEVIRTREVSAVEVLEAHLAQISKHNSKLNAICTLDERARTTAKQADEALARGENWGVLHGVPMTVKDVYETAGLRTTAGYKRLKDYIPAQDATVVKRLRAAGAIIIGKSNLAKLASDYQSTNDLFERVNNPWNLDCTAGGSSGGSAVAVATGMAPLEIGDDIGGSMRQPAHFCGVYSLKPTDRRISTAGHIPEVPGQPKCIRHILTPGCFARSIEDLQLWFSISLGTDSRQPDVAPVPLDTPSNKSLQNLKIAWTDGWQEIPVALEIQAAIKSFVSNLAQTGAYVENWSPKKFDLAKTLQLYNLLVALSMGYAKPWDFDDLWQVLPFMFREATQGDKALRDLSNLSQLLPNLLNPNPKKYFEVLTQRDRIIAQMDEALENWDVWLCPVATCTAFTHRAKGSAIYVNGRKIPYLLASGAYTMPFAFTGHPVMVIPIGKDNTGLPIGVQVIGKRWREMELLSIARQLAAFTQGFLIPPGY